MEICGLGLGEGGIGVELSMQERKNPDFDRLYRENGFYALISDNISLDRSIKDIRHPEYYIIFFLFEHIVEILSV